MEKNNPIAELKRLGQSVWLDQIDRGMIRSGQLARDLQRRCARPNVMVKIPATPAGLPAIQAMIAEGANINVTLIFAVERYVKVVEAYLAGLEEFSRKGGDLGRVHSVASFFVSRV